MALRSFNANWLEIFNDSSTQDIILLTFTFASSGGSAKFISGSVSVEAYSAFMGLDGMAPVGQQLDDYTRASTQEQFVCTFVDDENIRSLFTTKAMRGSLVLIEYGDRTLAEADLETAVKDWIVTDCVPVPGGFEVVIGDPTDWISTAETDAFFMPRPIPEAAKDALDRTGLTSNNINTDSFLSINHSDIAHVIVCRQLQGEVFGPGNWMEMVEPKTSKVIFSGSDRSPLAVRARGPVTWSTQARLIPDIIGELAFAGGASITYDPYTGKWVFLSYDNTDSADVHFTRDNISNFDQSDNYRNVINRMLLYGYGPYSQTSINYAVRSDGVAAARFTVGAFSPGVSYKAQIKSTNEWSQSFTRLEQLEADPEGPFDLTETTLAIEAPLLHGFSGMWQTDGAGARIGPPSEVQQSEHQISAGKPAWFRLTDHATGGKREIVKATACTFGAAVSGYGSITLKGVTDDESHWGKARYTVARADGSAEFHNTTAKDWSLAGTIGGWHEYFVYDITKEKLVADRTLQRFANGCPVCTITVPTVYGERLRLGGRVSGDMPEFVADGVDGATSATLFEIVGIAPHRPGDDSAGVDLVLSFVKDDTLPPSTITSDDVNIIEPIIPDFDALDGILGLVGTNIHQVYAADGRMIIGS